MLVEEKPTCRTCGRDATHWWWNQRRREFEFGCEGHAQVHIGDPGGKGESWGVVGEDNAPG